MPGSRDEDEIVVEAFHVAERKLADAKPLVTSIQTDASGNHVCGERVHSLKLL
jgi:hypothetical protein